MHIYVWIRDEVGEVWHDTIWHVHHLASSYDSHEASTLGCHGPLWLPFPCWPPGGSGAGAKGVQQFQGPTLAKPKWLKESERSIKIYKDLKGGGHSPSSKASQKHCALLTAAMQPTNSRTLSSSSSNCFQETRWRVWWYFLLLSWFKVVETCWDKSSFENHIGNGQSDKIWQAIVGPLDYDNLLTSIRTNAPLEPKVAFNSTSSSSSATEILQIWHLSDQGFLSWAANHTILYRSIYIYRSI